MNAPEKLGVETIEHTILRIDEWMFDDILDLVGDYYQESKLMQAFPYSEARVERMLAAAMMDPRVLGAAATDMKTKTVNGVVIASTGSVFYSDEPLVTDILLYVRPEFRGKGILRPMLDYYERWARRMGIKKIFFEQTSGIDVERTEKAFAAMGYQYAGSKLFKALAEPKEKK